MMLSSQAVAVSGLPRQVLQIELLGTPRTMWRGQPLPLARRQARGLLFRVAAAAQPVPRDQLCFLLWPDQPDAIARRNLSVLLDQLRRALPTPDLLLKSGDSIALNQQLIWSDTAAFTKHASVALRDGRLDVVAGATQLYRGSFLDGFALPGSAEFDEWASSERQLWERRFLDTLAALVEARSARAEYGAAIEAAQRYLAVDSLAEEMHRRAIALYAAMGDRGAALRQFERCVVALERELGVDPLPETRAVYEAVRDGNNPFESLPTASTRPATTLQSIPGAKPAMPVSARALPAPASPMLGRNEELAAARAQLRGKARLLTLCGPGGSGKTRLALAVAAAERDHYADGVVWVPLAPLRDPALVAEAIVQACGLQSAGAVDPATMLRAYLHDKQLLLVVDNLEHLLPAAPLLADLLAAAPGLQLLATSRSVLNIYGEHVLPVLPLALPDLEHLPPLDELAQQPAVALLLSRARAHNEAVRLTPENAAELAAICVQLDGLPLALELAAARLRLLSPRELLRRLDHRLALLEGGPRDLPERQQTLRATIAWSYQLLAHDEARLLDRLAVFAGGWTLAGAEAVCLTSTEADQVLDQLQALLEAHLVVRHDGPDAEPRFTMLETIREYALEQLEQQDIAATTAGLHAMLFLEQAEQAAQELSGPQQARYLALLDAEHSNLKLALETFYARGDSAHGLRLAAALERFWRARGYLHEGLWWIKRLLAQDGTPDVPVDIVARALDVACTLAYYQADLVAARGYAETGSALLRTMGRRRELALMLIKLVRIHNLLNDVAAAERVAHEATMLAKALADAEVDAELARVAADEAVRRGDMEQARAHYEGGLQFWRARGDSLRQIADLFNLANLALTLDDVAGAESYAKEMLVLSGSLASRSGKALALYTLGEIARYVRDLPRAEQFYRLCQPLLGAIGRRDLAAFTLHNLGCVALDRGNVAEARSLILDCRQRLPEARRTDAVSETLEALGRVAAVQGRPLQAARLWGAAETQLELNRHVRLPIDQREHDRYQALARAATTQLEFEAAWRAGRRLSAEHALAEEASSSFTPALIASAA